MKTKRALISGASIAGPALAYWLNRYGYEVTVVEKAPELRRGGQAVDFKGRIHLTVLERMGLLERVRALHVPSEDGFAVDAAGRKIGVIPGRFAGGEINVPRGDLARLLFALSKNSCRYIFGDSIVSLNETREDVRVQFERGETASFDLVIGADGLHSNVRRLAFGAEENFVRHLGFSYALVGLNTGDDDVMYNEPGRMIALGGSKAPAFFVFESAPATASRDDIIAQKKILIEAFRDRSWKTQEIVAQIPMATEFYMDSICRVTMPHYSRGRVVLVGDSAYGNALGGFGTGLALVGAYVLAGELRRAGEDYKSAFAIYEAKFRDYASVSQKVNAGRLLAPKTKFGIWARNLMFTSLAYFGPLMSLVDRPATNLKLEDYG